MTKSLALWLALLAARGDVPSDAGGPAGPAAGGAATAAAGGASGAGSWPEPPPGRGPLIWLRPGPQSGLADLALLTQRLVRLRNDLRFVVTPGPQPADPAWPPTVRPVFPPGTLLLAPPAERRPSIARFLERYAPDMLLLTGSGLPAVAIHETASRHIPIVLADAVMHETERRAWRWKSGMATALLERMARILVRDQDTARNLRRLTRPELALQVTGPIEEIAEPLPANEAEREALAALLRARPVWLAAGTGPEDEEALFAAHARASQFAHRMLLILAPTDPERGPEIARSLVARGWEVGLRSAEDEPEEEVQVFVADSEGEMGLWYRLAPVCFMGGTLTPETPGRDPFEPAALGSAILHGPETALRRGAYDRLARAEAARQVAGREELAEALIDLIAADRAATLAHNAWEVSSGGAGATETVARSIIETLEARAMDQAELARMALGRTRSE